MAASALQGRQRRPYPSTITMKYSISKLENKKRDALLVIQMGEEMLEDPRYTKEERLDAMRLVATAQRTLKSINAMLAKETAHDQ